MHAIDKQIPHPAWIDSLRRRFPCEAEIDRVLTRKMTRRAGPAYSAVSLDDLCKGVDALLRSHVEGPFEIRAPRWMTGGASKIQMAFDLAWNRPGVGATSTTMVLRMEPSESIVETSRLREFQLLKAFVGIVPVPPVFWVDNEGDFLPYPAMICGFTRGVTKPSSGDAGISGMGINFGTARESIGRQFIQHLATIHTHNCTDADLSALNHPSLGTGAVEWQLNWWERVWEEDVNEDVPLMRLTMAWLRANMPPVDHLSIVHGDYRTGNFLYTEEDNRISAILDWELGHFGDRHEDLAWTMRQSFGHAAEDGKTFLIGGFMPESRFMDLYQELSGLPVDRKRIRYYDVFNAYKHVVIVLATGCRVARGGKGHQDVILAWLTGLGYTIMEDMRLLMEDVLRSPA